MHGLMTRLADYFRVPPANYRDSANRHIPESFIWHLFEGLVDACLVLEQGRKDVAVKDWKPLVHNDLHEGNIMLNSNPNDPTVSVGCEFPQDVQYADLLCSCHLSA